MIRRNPNGTYTARLHGHPQRTFDRKRDAEEYEDGIRDRRRRQRAGLRIEQDPVTFRELVDLWKANNAPSDWRLRMLDYAITRWGDVLVSAIQPQALGAWIHALEGNKGRKLSGKTKRHVLETMRQVLGAAVEWGYITQSPARARAFKVPSDKRVRPIRPFESWAEVERVATAIGPSGPLVRFVCATGLTTPGEWINASWKDIDLVEKEMRVHGTKTVNRARVIPLGAQAIAALEELPRALSGRLFIGKRGGQLDYHQWRKVDWHQALAACGLPDRTPNEMRHTFATLALSAGVPIDDVSSILGHGDVAITYRYYRKWIRPMADRARTILDTIGEEKDEHERVREGRSGIPSPPR